jgi:hypothetical protein
MDITIHQCQAPTDLVLISREVIQGHIVVTFSHEVACSHTTLTSEGVRGLGFGGSGSTGSSGGNRGSLSSLGSHELCLNSGKLLLELLLLLLLGSLVGGKGIDMCLTQILGMGVQAVSIEMEFSKVSVGGVSPEVGRCWGGLVCGVEECHHTAMLGSV